VSFVYFYIAGPKYVVCVRVIEYPDSFIL
jgi:hypothetical protein